MDTKGQPKTFAEMYSTGGMFSEWSGIQDEGLHSHEAELISRRVPDKSAAICTLGCGCGRETFALYRAGYHNVCGTDFTAALLDMAKHRAQQDGLPIKFMQCPCQQILLSDASVDVVTMFSNILGHLTPRQIRMESLHEIRRILKPGGLVMLDANSIWHRFYYVAYFTATRFLRKVWNPMNFERGDKLFHPYRDSPPARIHWFEPDEIDRDAGMAGFRVVQRTTVEQIKVRPESNSRRTYRQGWLVYVLAAE
jgi:ubiquinone/menaquinone biosynthesis C-methylase UbiE